MMYKNPLIFCGFSIVCLFNGGKQHENTQMNANFRPKSIGLHLARERESQPNNHMVHELETVRHHQGTLMKALMMRTPVMRAVVTNRPMKMKLMMKSPLKWTKCLTPTLAQKQKKKLIVIFNPTVNNMY